MLAHLIHYKGKGGWVVGLPLIISFVLFVFADALALNDRFIGSITLLTTGIALFLVDSKREKIMEGDIVQRSVKLPRIKNRNTFIWIEVRYWEILMTAIGVIWLFSLLA